MLIDTHCHIHNIIKSKISDANFTEQEIEKAQEIIQSAQLNDVKKIINVSTSLIESICSINLAKRFNNVYSAVGIHPNDISNVYKEDIIKLKELIKNDLNKNINTIKAIGECGLDYHYPGFNKAKQYDNFKRQIELALEFNLPIIIHTRDAQDEVLKILEDFKDKNLRGVIHCFSEDLSFAKDAFKLNFMLGIGGTVTYPRNDRIRNVVKTVGLEHIILETDSPFLPPQNMRGKKNYPSNIKTIANYIAELLNISIDKVSLITTNNAEKLFDI